MPIIKWNPTVSRTQAFQTGLLHLVQLKRIPDGIAVNQYPVPVYNFTLQEVIANADLGNVTGKLVSWRYYAGEDLPDTAVSGDVDVSTPRVTSLTYGEGVWKAVNAAKAAEELPQFLDRGYRPQLLRIPGLLTEAYWLKPAIQPLVGQEVGWIVPYHTLIKSLDPAKPYLAGEFFQLISPLAEKTLASNDSP